MCLTHNDPIEYRHIRSQTGEQRGYKVLVRVENPGIVTYNYYGKQIKTKKKVLFYTPLMSTSVTLGHFKARNAAMSFFSVTRAPQFAEKILYGIHFFKEKWMAESVAKHIFRPRPTKHGEYVVTMVRYMPENLLGVQTYQNIEGLRMVELVTTEVEIRSYGQAIRQK